MTSDITREAVGRLEKVVATMPSHVLHFALRAVYGRSAANAKFEADLRALLAELATVKGERDDVLAANGHLGRLGRIIERQRDEALERVRTVDAAEAKLAEITAQAVGAMREIVEILSVPRRFAPPVQQAVSVAQAFIQANAAAGQAKEGSVPCA